MAADPAVPSKLLLLTALVVCFVVQAGIWRLAALWVLQVSTLANT